MEGHGGTLGKLSKTTWLVRSRGTRKAVEGTGLGHLVLVIKLASKGPTKLNTVEAVRNGMGGDSSKELSRLCGGKTSRVKVGGGTGFKVFQRWKIVYQRTLLRKALGRWKSGLRFRKQL